MRLVTRHIQVFTIHFFTLPLHGLVQNQLGEDLSRKCTRRAARGEGLRRNKNSWIGRLPDSCSMSLLRPLCKVADASGLIFASYMPFCVVAGTALCSPDKVAPSTATQGARSG